MGRRLGQHFLTDRSILDRIVEAINPTPDDVVIEIGPGRGDLTARLASRVGSVIAIEKDRALVERLREEGRGKREESREEGRGKREEEKPSRLTIVEGDALLLEWADLIRELTLPSSLFPLSYKVIGNIPYYITSPLIEKALTPPAPQVTVFLVQREFADRLVAAPGSKIYGALTAGVRALATVERLFAVRAGAFKPPPKVDSAVVRLCPRTDPLVTQAEHGAFRTFLAALFSQRRKQLTRGLRGVTGAGKEPIEAMLLELGIDPQARPEVLMPEQLVLVFRHAKSLTELKGRG